MEKKKATKPVASKKLLELCAGSQLEKSRLAHLDELKTKNVVIDSNGIEMEADEWKKINKKIIQA